MLRDGYTQEQTVFFTNDETGLGILVDEYGRYSMEHYDFVRELVVPHSPEEMDRVVRRYQEQERQKEQERAADEAELKRLAEKLGKTVI